MAKARVHLLSEIEPNWGYPKWYHYIQFGECSNPDREGLWFVTIPQGQYQYHEEYETHWPAEDHTFFVAKENATPFFIEHLRRDVTKWKEVAESFVVGSWCSEYECLWSERPIFSLTLEEGVEVKYGLCKTQPQSSGRVLWFVALNTEGGHTFLVDKACATPEVIHALGDDWKEGWMKICWCHLEHEVQWDLIGTFDDSTSLVTWQLDSPYIPESVDLALKKVQQYQEEKGS